MWSGVRDAFAVVIDGLRLAGRHLPVLLTIYLFGAAVHGGIIWLSVNVSNDWALPAQLIMPLAPIATLVALILMLRTLSPSLGWADFGASEGTSPGRRMGQRIGLLASLLVPFLTVYSAQGFLQRDREQFINMAAVNEFRERADFFYGGGGPDRFLIGSKAVILGVIIGAFVLRRLINHFDLAERSAGVGVVAAYVEIFWMFSLATWAASLVELFDEWRNSRAFTVWVLDAWQRVVELLGPVGAPVKAVVDWAVGILSNGTDLVVIPIAWLTVGAVAYGRRSVVTGDGTELPAGRWSGRWSARVSAVRDRTARVPEPIRRVGRNATADVRDRFRSFTDGVKVLMVAGFVPMLMFCVVFAVAKLAERGVGELLRLLRGPVVVQSGLAIEPWLGVLRTGAYTVLLVGLIAAAIDRIVRRRAESDSALPGGPEAPGAPESAAPESARPQTGPLALEPAPAGLSSSTGRGTRYEWPTA